jgi:glycosyltransferase involved in cell wall biosynthesis
MPFISVVMPVYNGEQYILESINSILSQTIKDIELIIIDDGSTDRGSQIIQSIDDNRIVYRRSEENMGVGGDNKFRS